uniref:Porin family protein n=1 Tax=Yoonia rhodophyticola TaxID=3137370 RepID=A0AAN0NJS7_9RHOB
MKNVMTAGAALLLTTSIASAGGIDRTGNPYSVLFEDGNYAQLSFSSVMPEVSGDYPATFGGGSTDNMAESYLSFGAAVKYAVTSDLDVALFITQPYGADASYEAGAYTGLAAEWNSTQLSVLGKFKAAEGVSLYGGLSIVQSDAEITIPAALASAAAGAPTPEYTAQASSDVQVGYVVGPPTSALKLRCGSP